MAPPELVEHLVALNARVSAQGELLKLCLGMLAQNDRDTIEGELRAARVRVQEVRLDGRQNAILETMIEVLEVALVGRRVARPSPRSRPGKG